MHLETPIPRNLYRYQPIDNKLESSLIDNYLWFSNPLDFNDLYDCNLKLYLERDKKVMARHFKKVNEDASLTGNAPLDAEAFENRVNYLYNNPDELESIVQRQIIKFISTIGICCFSKRDDNLLMWSHYSQSHKGVCLKFDLQNDFEFLYCLLQFFILPAFRSSTTLEKWSKCKKGNYRD